MKVLIVNTSEKTGGAAVAANRLAESLINNGVKVKMLVLNKQTDTLYVVRYGHSLLCKLAFLLERITIWIANAFSRTNLFAVSIANTGVDITKTPEFKEADIIHLHWINQGMLSLRGIRKIIDSGKPIVWTMHDMWECTAICHHAYTCKAYQEYCHHCPFLRFPSNHDLAALVFSHKQRVLRGAHIHYVAVSKWLAERAGKSALLQGQPVCTIPNSISLSRFVPVDRIDARLMLHIQARYVVTFGAARLDTPIKGLQYLKDALRLLVTSERVKREDVCLLLFGGLKDRSLLDDLAVPYIYMGLITDDEQLSAVYSAANVLVSSSLYETFGQTLIEAQMCGCIPVSFDNSGQTDIIDHKKNGYLARYLSVDDLADGIMWALNSNISIKDLRANVVRKFSESVVANKYIQLYSNITDATM